MALIKCTECGKSFSDKAACCPECGCPTDVVLKESKSPQAIAKQQQTSEQASATMLAEVEKEGLFSTIEQGKFGGVKRPRDGGKGLEGVCVKDDQYFNPFIPLMLGGAE